MHCLTQLIIIIITKIDNRKSEIESEPQNINNLPSKDRAQKKIIQPDLPQTVMQVNNVDYYYLRIYIPQQVNIA